MGMEQNNNDFNKAKSYNTKNNYKSTIDKAPVADKVVNKKHSPYKVF